MYNKIDKFANTDSLSPRTKLSANQRQGQK